MEEVLISAVVFASAETTTNESPVPDWGVTFTQESAAVAIHDTPFAETEIFWEPPSPSRMTDLSETEESGRNCIGCRTESVKNRKFHYLIIK